MTKPRNLIATRWRVARSDGSLELVRRPPGGGPAIWLGTVEPMLEGACRYSTPNSIGIAATQDDAKRAVEAAANGQ